MKVIYEKTIGERILEEKQASQKKGKTIEKVVLTDPEYHQLCAECGYACLPMTSMSTFAGVKIEREQQTLNKANFGRYNEFLKYGGYKGL